MPIIPVSRDIRGKLVFLGTGTSHGVPMIGCDCPTCGSSDPRNYRTRCGLAIGLPAGNLLIDTPTDLRTQLLREKIGLVHAVAFTHEHADHLYGLDDLRLFPHYIGGPVPIYCEQRVEQKIRRSFEYIFDERLQAVAKERLPQLTFESIDTDPFEALGATIVPVRLLHGDQGILGFRIGNVAYCTDVSRIPDESWDRLRELDVVVLDCLRIKPHATHFSLPEAVAAAERIGARRTLFTHMSHDLEHEATNRSLPTGMELAYDGLEIPLR